MITTYSKYGKICLFTKYLNQNKLGDGGLRKWTWNIWLSILMKFNAKIIDFIKAPTEVHFSLQPVEILKYFVVIGHQQSFIQKQLLRMWWILE